MTYPRQVWTAAPFLVGLVMAVAACAPAGGGGGPPAPAGSVAPSRVEATVGGLGSRGSARLAGVDLPVGALVVVDGGRVLGLGLLASDTEFVDVGTAGRAFLGFGAGEIFRRLPPLPQEDPCRPAPGW